MELSSRGARNLLVFAPALTLDAWVPLCAASAGVSPEALSSVFGGAGTAVLFEEDAATVLPLFAQQWGWEAAEALADGDDRLEVLRTVDALRQASTGSARAGRDVEVVSSVPRALDAMLASTPAVLALGAEELVELVTAAASASGAAFRERAAWVWQRAEQSLPSLPGRASLELVCDMLSSEAFAALDTDTAAVVAAAVFGTCPAAAARVAVGEDVALAAAQLVADETASTGVSGWWNSIGVAAAAYLSTGAPSAAATAFGVSSVAELSVDRARAVTESMWSAASLPRWSMPGDPVFVDAWLEALAAAGLHVDAQRLCLGLASPGIDVELVASFASPVPDRMLALGDEFAEAMARLTPPAWALDDVLAALDANPAMDAAVCARLPMLWSRWATDAFRPKAYADRSMRTVGLGPWVESMGPLVAKRCAVAAPAGLSDAAWSTVWSLVEGFSGTPEELVALAEVVSPA
jgi:hypothetical protein